MTVLNTNISALVAQNAVNRNQKVMAQAMERLSTGKRINNGADDPAGLAISARMEMASLIKAIFEKIDDIELNGEPKYMQSTFVGGLKSLPIAYKLK